MPTQNYQYFRIATSEAGLPDGHFFTRNLPEPLPPILTDYSVKSPQSTGGKSRQGYAKASVIWAIFTQSQANTLRRLVEAAEATGGEGNGTLWLTVPRTTGDSSGVDWVDISGIADMPDLQPEAVGLYSNVTLTLNDVTIENEPSTVL
jgi:hypothetical protein